MSYILISFFSSNEPTARERELCSNNSAADPPPAAAAPPPRNRDQARAGKLYFLIPQERESNKAPLRELAKNFRNPTPTSNPFKADLFKRQRIPALSRIFV
jgi:hypothetical protein